MVSFSGSSITLAPGDKAVLISNAVSWLVTQTAVSTPTANRIAQYDANKRLKSGAAPSASDDVVRKADVVTTEEDGLMSATDKAKLDNIFRVGAIYMSVENVSPATFIGGTWTVWGSGRVPVGVDSSDADFNTVEKTSGAKTHILSTNEMPSHTHIQDSHNHTQNQHRHSYTEPDGTQNTSDSWTTPFVKSYSSGSTGYTTATNIAATATNQNTGGGAAHNNLQPYITCYMWKRIG
jgi:hypothetical protein